MFMSDDDGPAPLPPVPVEDLGDPELALPQHVEHGRPGGDVGGWPNTARMTADSDRITIARLMGRITRHATARTPTAEAVPNIRALADGRTDLLETCEHTYREKLSDPAWWFAERAAALAHAARE